MEEKLKSASGGRTPKGTGTLRGPTDSAKEHMPRTPDARDPHLRHYPSLANSGTDDDFWETRSRSNESDVELVPISRPDRAIKRPDP